MPDLTESVVSELELGLALRSARDNGELTGSIVENLGDERANLFSTLAANIPRAAVFLIDEALRCVAIDGALVRGPGRDPAALIGRTMRELAGDTVTDDAFEPIAEMYRRTLKGESLSADFVQRERTLELHTAPVREGLGHVTAGVVLALDVTAERQLAAALQERDQLYRDIVTHFPNGAVFTLDRELRYLSADGPALADLLRGTDLIGKAVRDVVSEPNAADTLAIYSAALEGKTGRFEAVRGARAYELTAVPRRDASGAIVGVLVVCYEVTERKRAHEAAETFRLMVDSIQDHAIFQLDVEGNVRTWNAGARAIKGYEAGEIIGRSFDAFYPPEERASAERTLAIARTQGHHEWEGFRVRKDGSRFWASVAITAMRDPLTNTVSGFVKLTRDLTERKRGEDAKARALAEKTAMLQEIHHRVKNNLQMISSLLSVQGREIVDPSARAMFLDTQTRVRSIALLHESLYQSNDLGRVDMRAYVDTLLSTLRQAYGDPKASIVAAADRIYLPVNIAVPCGLIINELVTNSMKHAFPLDSSDNQIRVKLRQVEGDLLVTVVDNGVGLGMTRDPRQSDTMGMTLVRDLAQQLRGRTEFTATNGSRVRFPAPSGMTTV